MEVFCGKCKYYKYKSSGYGSDHYHCRKQVTEEITNSFTRKHTAVHYGDARDINEKMIVLILNFPAGDLSKNGDI